MDPKELLDAGRLSAALEQLNQDVRAHPVDMRLRTFLFELLCFNGDFERAQKQLDIIAQQNASSELGVQVYRSALTAERARARLFSDGHRPGFVQEPPPFASLHLEALNRVRERRPGEARTLLEQSAESRAAVEGRMEGQEFSDFSDADAVLGPFLEVFIQDRYVWFPFMQLKRISISLPKRLRDLLWIPAKLESFKGVVGEVLLPVLYSGSCGHPDDQVRLGRMTDWQNLGDDLMRGQGQRIFFVGDSEKAILEAREIEFLGD